MTEQSAELLYQLASLILLIYQSEYYPKLKAVTRREVTNVNRL
jgi:hypothetical protein